MVGYDELSKSSNFSVTCLLENGGEPVTIKFTQKKSVNMIDSTNLHVNTDFFGKDGSDVCKTPVKSLFVYLALKLPFTLDLGYVKIPIAKVELVDIKRAKK